MSDFCVFGKYIYTGLLGRFCAYSKSEFFALLGHMQGSKNGYFIGFVDYELFENSDGQIVAEFAHFSSKSKLKCPKNSSKFSIFAPFFYPNISKKLNKNAYKKAFLAVKNELENGNSYQINFSDEIELFSRCDGFCIFKELYFRQKSNFACYFKSQNREIISLSPELFFKLSGKNITFAPMKGTIKRGANKNEDRKLKEFLKKDSKTRCENLMIVDLLRNDMSRVIKTGSLRIKKLMKIIKLKTLFQAISVLNARLKKADLSRVFEAVYPCGSVTGTPKLSTMRIIKALENRKRGVYCGAIGVLSAKNSTFSVPIRTLEKRKNESFYRYGVGSGLVWDSDFEDEFSELELKASFLKPKIDFELFETMLMYENKVFLLSEHLKRLSRSASLLGFDMPYFGSFDEEILEFSSFKAALDIKNPKFFEKLTPFFAPFALENKSEFSRLHLVLSKNAKIKITQSSIPSISSNKILIAKKQLSSQNDLIYYKTTLRDEHIVPRGYFDIVYFNEKNELCEGSRSNIVLDMGEGLLTPSLDSGLLAGTLREVLLKNSLIKEAKLSLNDLKNAKKIYCINSLRGALEVVL